MNIRASEQNSPRQHKHQDSREEKLTKNELTDNEDPKKKKEKEWVKTMKNTKMRCLAALNDTRSPF